jgi:hypothetical protein
MGMPVVCAAAEMALDAADRRAVEQVHAQIDEMAEMMPEDVVAQLRL